MTTQPFEQFTVTGNCAEPVTETGRQHLVEARCSTGHVIVDDGRGEDIGLERHRPESASDEMDEQLVAQAREGRDSVCRLTEAQEDGRTPGQESVDHAAKVLAEFSGDVVQFCRHMFDGIVEHSIETSAPSNRLKTR